MRWLILLLLTAGVTLGYPTLFGKTGMPLIWDDITVLSADSIDGRIGTFTTLVVDSANTQHLVVDVGATSAGAFDLTISTDVAGGETGLYSYLTHITNALTGNLIGVRGNARVSTIDSPSGAAIGGYFQAGNATVGTDMSVVRGVYAEIVNKVPSGATTWDYARGVEVNMDLDQGTSGNANTITDAQMFYGVYNLPTVGTYSTVTNGYGMFLRNEAVGGTGQMLDAGFYLDDLNHSGGILGWDFGIDFSGIGANSGAFGTADIRGANGETIDNNTDGAWGINADITIFGAGSAGAVDIIQRYHEADADHDWIWSDANSFFFTSEKVRVGSFICSNLVVGLTNGMQITSMGLIENIGNVTTLTLDPNKSGQGTIPLGVSGDADIVLLNGSEFHTASTSYDSTATLAAGVYMCILDQAASQDTLNLPAVASHTGRMVVIKCINANGSVVDANSTELIDASQTQALSQWDSMMLFCTGAAWLII